MKLALSTFVLGCFSSSAELPAEPAATSPQVEVLARFAHEAPSFEEAGLRTATPQPATGGEATFVSSAPISAAGALGVSLASLADPNALDLRWTVPRTTIALLGDAD
ncbi:MAG: hypothetical protein KC656_28740 [Myxococcales bacterium]|nr:hypothetical protein [Myxococcales bacterium]MCB9669844.1 hypothetical protein [Alphaproteobacteria bacterium]MCB9694557.1 hypothetical protein [Alphaproteobacteria bacterium]